MNIKLISISLLLVSSISHAGSINSITIFHTNTVTVTQDVDLKSHPTVELYNMDTKNNATARLNKLMQQRLASNLTAENYVIANSEAFDEVLNGPNWDVVYEALERGGRAIELAIRYKVKKTPAIVFNDAAVIYGVTSLSEAVRIYHTKVR